MPYLRSTIDCLLWVLAAAVTVTLLPPLAAFGLLGLGAVGYAALNREAF